MTFDTVILKLPRSEELVKIMSCSSGNSRGARYWTDGKIDAPMFRSRHALMKTREDGLLFWVEDCKEVARVSHSERITDQWKEVDRPNPATEADFMYAIAWGFGDTPKKEKRLRIDLWHAGNDHLRSGEKQALPVIHLENLKNLLSLLSEENQMERLMKAEVYRELGMFDQSLKTLDFEFEENFHITRNALMKLALAKSAQVAEIN